MMNEIILSKREPNIIDVEYWCEISRGISG